MHHTRHPVAGGESLSCHPVGKDAEAAQAAGLRVLPAGNAAGRAMIASRRGVTMYLDSSSGAAAHHSAGTALLLICVPQSSYSLQYKLTAAPLMAKN